MAWAIPMQIIPSVASSYPLQKLLIWAFSMFAATRTFAFAILLVSGLCLTSVAQADLITNPPMTITMQVTVNPVILSNTGGSNQAEFFGNTFQQPDIEGYINEIWAQAGIQISFQTPEYWNNTFANVGSSSPRPTSDLGTIVTNAAVAGHIDPDPNVINMFFVEIAAGFSDVGENSANGLAYIGGNGVTQHVGDNLVGFKAGQEVIASVVAHEIGHNLGLPHLVGIENLMQPGGSPNPGERLNASQISVARSSSFSQAVPEPASSLALLSLAGIIALRHRHRRRPVA